MRLEFLWFALTALACVPDHAQTATAVESPEERVALLELFTSEGCSSCPPAEAWLSSLKDSPGLWREFVPVAFHVDYWDSLGWPDRFASPVLTRRQRAYAAEWKATTVYTPGFVLNGSEWRRTNSLPTLVRAKAGRLRASVSDGGNVEVFFAPIGRIDGPLMVSIASLGQGVSTDVRRGENAGKVLQHNFLALSLVQAELVATSSGEYTARLTLPIATTAPISGVAVWVHPTKSLAPIQATGGWLEKPIPPAPL